MEIPLTFFLILYGAVIIVFLFLSFFILYHAIRFGQVTLLNFFFMLVYAAGSVALLVASARFIDAHDWSQTVEIFVFFQSVFF